MPSKKRNKPTGHKQLEFGFKDSDCEDKARAPVVKTAERASEIVPCAVVAPLVSKPGRSLQGAANALHSELRRRTGLTIQLRITNNSSTMMSVRYAAKDTLAILRLHHMFLHAPADVRTALAAWVLKPSSKVPGRKLQAYIDEQRHLISRRSPRKVVTRTAGRYVDLKALYDEVNAECFAGEVTALITWGRMPALRRRRSIRFGSYSPSEDLVRIHPLLDQAFVPSYFVRYIVFHEMLHAHMGIEEGPSGRRKIHPPEFRAREAEYTDFQRAVAWMDNEKNLRRLLLAMRK